MRTLRRISSFHVLAIVMLAVGVGATTAIFSVVNGVLLRPLPFPHPQQLMLVGEQSPQAPNSFEFFVTPSAFLTWQEQATDFQGLTALQGASFTLLDHGTPRVIGGANVTSNFFNVLQATPQLGRLFQPADAADSTHPIVITDALWHSAFNGDPGIIGQSVGAPGHESRVIGVLPANLPIGGSELGPMMVGEPADFFSTFAFGPNSGGDLKRVWSNFNYTVIGRLKPGVTVEQALQQLNTVQHNLAANAPDPAPNMVLQGQIMPVLEYATQTSRRQLWLLLGAVAAVLLIISVNLGGLWVSRVVDRRRDWAIRISLGAQPGLLARQVLREGLAMGLVGGAVGIACASVGLQALLALAPRDIPRLEQVHMDWRVLVAGFVLAAVAGLFTGLLPALRVARGNPQESLKAGSAATTAGPASVRSRQGLIGLQAGLTTLLLAVAGLLGASLYQLMTKPAGFNSEHAIEARIVTWSYDKTQRDRILQQISGALEAIPGVQVAGLTSHLPLQGETWIDGAGVPGKEYPPAQEPKVNVRFVGGDYFKAMSIPLIAGRDFRETDRPAGWPAKTDEEYMRMHQSVIISKATAQLLWPGRDPQTLIGEPMIFNGLTPTIIGVSADALDGTLTDAPPAVVYQPYWNWDPGSFAVVLRTSLPVSAVAAPLRRAIAALAPNAPISEIKALSSLRAQATAPQRYQFTLLMTFAALALLLAAVGVYALVAHSVAQRKKELAIRLALGAPSAAIRSLIASQALAPVAIGAGVGLVAAIAGGQLLTSLLYGVGAHNPLTLGGAGLVVVIVAAIACVLPARRATRVNPNAVLRAE